MYGHCVKGLPLVTTNCSFGDMLVLSMKKWINKDESSETSYRL